MQAEAQVAGDGDAVLADHGYAGAAVWEGLLVMWVCEGGEWLCLLMEKGEDMLDVVVWCLVV